MVVMYLNIISQMYLLVSLDTQKTIDSEDRQQIVGYITKFADKSNSRLMVVYRGV